MPPTIQERFYAMVNKNGPVDPTLGTPCHLWTGFTHKGYGRFSVNGKTERAHRVAWTLIGGREIPEGHDVLHRCNNFGCVNYGGHLFTGTHTQSMQIMALKGRSGNAILTPDLAIELRALRDEGWTYRELMNRFGIANPTVSQVVTRKHWKLTPQELSQAL